ncbi:MAG TPA: folylpolyglutamate synthase/dihydrofolate synthase family protein [Nitriliruptorales bacterium]
MDFTEALEGLRQRIPASIGEPDLERMRAMAALMGDPQTGYPAIQITGTNGKTSTARMIAVLLDASGISAGLYTSPHLQSIRERLTAAGMPITEREFTDVYADLAPLLELVDEQRGDHITYFEALTAMAYWWFADKPVEVGVFEVGMGGRWDATNLVRGEVAVLTAIDVDHSELGDTPEAVAGEKVGIVKPGATVICAEQAPEVLAIIEDRATEVGARLWRAGRDFGVRDRRIGVGGQGVTLDVGERRIEVFLPAFGAHQAANAALALAAYAAFLGDAWDNVDDDLVRQGFAAVETPGRLEVVHREPTVLLDGAHNPHGARTAAAAIGEAFSFRNLIVVLAVLADKDIDGIVGAYVGIAHHVVVTRAPTHRSATVPQLAAIAQARWAGTGVAVETAANVDEALDKATGVAGEGDGVLVTGSLYAVGAARERYLPLGNDEPDLGDYGSDLPQDPFDLLDGDAEE